MCSTARVQERFAATLVRPIAAEEALQVVDHQSYDSLRKEFRCGGGGAARCTACVALYSRAR